ncbi:MAG: 3-isopropylmalate dehydratase large subunit [Candidatus Altiarchaeales archaeon WOR_SM1_79]|nr:MAG: 3-isopropylmalate dehydratase large subunit [Candidatus Altiarchaeales archaeon WOR_SM1_79]
MKGTLVEKIFGKKTGKNVSAGDLIVSDIDFIMGQDGTTPLAISAFKKMGDKVKCPDRIALVIDHSAPSPNEGVSKLHKMMYDFGREQGIENFYDIGDGVCHQVMAENHVSPGDVVVGSDSHTCTYGALGAFSTGIGSTDAAAVYKTQKLWFRVPETYKFNISGDLQKGVYSKDLILHIIKEMTSDGATYKSCEFHGDAIKKMSVDARMTITNMAVEMGAKNGVIEPDPAIATYINKHRRGKTSDMNFRHLKSDGEYEEEFVFEINELEPQIACPHTVDNVCGVSEIQGHEIDQAFIGTCTNGRLEDLKIASEILRGNKVKSRLIIAPASRRIFMEAINEGIIQIFMKSGACVVNPGCACCVGTHQGVPSDNEIIISSANRNFKGRMGNSSAEIYLASPATVAASAVEGKITDPRDIL